LDFSTVITSESGAICPHPEVTLSITSARIPESQQGRFAHLFPMSAESTS